jgi:hypothetical protein
MNRTFDQSFPGDIFELVFECRHFGKFVIRTYDPTHVYEGGRLRVDNYNPVKEKKGLCTGVIGADSVLRYIGHNSKYST